MRISLTATPSGRNSVTATLTPTTPNSTVTLDIAAGIAQDLTGNNDNTAATQLSVVFDNTPPEASIGPPGPTNSATTTVTVTFDEDVFNFTEAGIQLTNATMTSGSFSQTNAHTYTFQVNATTEGMVTVLPSLRRYSFS